MDYERTVGESAVVKLKRHGAAQQYAADVNSLDLVAAGRFEHVRGARGGVGWPPEPARPTQPARRLRSATAIRSKTW